MAIKVKLSKSLTLYCYSEQSWEFVTEDQNDGICIMGDEIANLIKFIQKDYPVVRKQETTYFLDEALNSGDGTYKP